MKKKLLTYMITAALLGSVGNAVVCSAETEGQETAAQESSWRSLFNVSEKSESEDALMKAFGRIVAALTAKTQIEEETEEQTESKTEECSVLEDGVYVVDFDTDSSMFHVNEANNGKGLLTVEDGEMTVHITLVSKSIVNLYPGLAEDAEKEGAVWLEPTTDSVTYSDGWTEDVYGFDVPVPALDEEFDLALIGTKQKWYDHKVCVSNPEIAE